MNTARKILVYFLLAVTIGLIGYTLFIYNFTLSDGVRSGVLSKFSNKGILFKTWEGELNEGFVGDLIKIGKKMDEAKIEYGNAMNKLVDGKGNLITSVEKLKKMGAKAKKALPESVLKRAENEENLLTEENN